MQKYIKLDSREKFLFTWAQEHGNRNCF